MGGKEFWKPKIEDLRVFRERAALHAEQGIDRKHDPDRKRFESLKFIDLFTALMPTQGVSLDNMMVRGSMALFLHQTAFAERQGETIVNNPLGVIYHPDGEEKLVAPHDVDLLLLHEEDSRNTVALTEAFTETGLVAGLTKGHKGRSLDIPYIGTYQFLNERVSGINMHIVDTDIEVLDEMVTVIPEGAPIRPRSGVHIMPTDDPELFEKCSVPLPRLDEGMRAASLPFLAFWETIMPTHGSKYLSELRRLGLDPEAISVREQITYLAKGFEASREEQSELVENILDRIRNHVPDREYILLPGDPMAQEERDQMRINQEFIANLLQDRMKNSDAALTVATTDIMGHIMASVDRNYGDGKNNPGRKYLENPLDDRSIPMFYHNGESLRIVLKETVDIMNQDIQAKGKASAYYDPKIFMATIIAAGAADLISDKPRGTEERDTAELMRNILSLDLWGYDFSREKVMLPNEQGDFEEKSMTDVIADAIISTTFNEEEATQQGGRGPIADAVLDGDLAILYRRGSTKKAMELMIEDTWREATSTLWGRELRKSAIREGFVGTTAREFFAFMSQRSQIGMPSPLAELASKCLVRNIEFIYPEGTRGHTYKIDLLNSEKIKQHRRDNAQLQWTIGVLVGAGQLSLVDAYDIAEEYALSEITLEQFLEEKDLRVHYGLAA